jgi:H+-transporting ATPase
VPRRSADARARRAAVQAGSAIAALKDQLKPEAIVKRDNRVYNMNATLLVPGDRIVLAAGAAVPADCTLCEGKPLQVDQAALTGESLPVTMYPGDVPKMGSTITRGESEAIVTGTGAETFFGKTAALIEGVDELGHFEKVLREIMWMLVGAGSIVTGIVLVYLLAEGNSFLDVLSFCVVLLIASIPIAMRVVCVTTLAIGCGELAAEKAIVARISSIEEMAGMTILCSDKTGTLTLNKMVLQQDLPVFCPGINRQDVLVAAALAAKWWEPPKDALDTLVLGAVDISKLSEYKQVDYTPFNPTIKRTEAIIQRKDGSTFKVMKGAPQILLEMAENRAEISEAVDNKVMELAKRGIRSLAVSCTKDEHSGWIFMGIMTFLDPPRPDTKHTIDRAKEFGVAVKMITGDHKTIAIETCRQLGMGTNVLGADRLPMVKAEELESMDTLGRDYGGLVEQSDGFAQVFPEHKYLLVEALRQRGHICGMTGDGVNDAPALKRADVGIAVQGATDAAQAAADIVLTEPGLSTIVTAIVTSRKIFQRMKNFVIYRVACTEQLLVFFFVSCILMNPQKYNSIWPNYFDIPVIALVTITILNDGTIISISYDNVEASMMPEKWDLNILYVVSSVIGAVELIASLWLLHMALNSNTAGCAFEKMGIEGLSFGQIQTLLYLQLALSAYMTVFVSRTKSWLWSRTPSWQLSAACVLATACSTFLSAYWPFGNGMVGIPWKHIGATWVYVLIWMIAQDAAKVFTYNWLYKLGYIQEIATIDESKLVRYQV